jgi:hypothetical protein
MTELIAIFVKELKPIIDNEALQTTEEIQFYNIHIDDIE